MLLRVQRMVNNIPIDHYAPAVFFPISVLIGIAFMRWPTSFLKRPNSYSYMPNSLIRIREDHIAFIDQSQVRISNTLYFF